MKREETDNLDKLLSERLKRALGDGGKANWLDVRRRAGLSTRWHWSRARIVLVAAVLVLAVGACAGSTGVIPWLNQKPAKSKYHPPKLAPACTAEGLKGELWFQGATGSLAGVLTLTNVGGSSCSLVGRPGVSFTGPAARVTRSKIQLDPSLAKIVSSGNGDIQAPRGSLRALEPGRKAEVALWWSNWCGPRSATGGSSGAPPTGIELRLGGGSHLVVPLRQWGTPRCDDSSQVSSLRISPFEPAVKEAPARTRLPLRVTIVGKRTIHRYGNRFLLHRGEVFRYRVALKNTSKSPFRFKSCPSYSEGLALTKPELTYTLNCRSVGTISPGETVFFSMEYRVPANARLGNSGLGWELASKTNNPPSADAAVLVVS